MPPASDADHSAPDPSSRDLVLVADTGGTKTAAWLAALSPDKSHQILGQARTSAGNPLSVGFEKATQAIHDALSQARDSARKCREWSRSPGHPLDRRGSQPRHDSAVRHLGPRSPVRQSRRDRVRRVANPRRWHSRLLRRGSHRWHRFVGIWPRPGRRHKTLRRMGLPSRRRRQRLRPRPRCLTARAAKSGSRNGER